MSHLRLSAGWIEAFDIRAELLLRPKFALVYFQLPSELVFQPLGMPSTQETFPSNLS